MTDKEGIIMHWINDVVVYGLHGVCRITEIEEKEFAGETHLYYTMHPVFKDRSTFFVPVNNEKVRDLLTPEEIKKLVYTIPQQEIIEVQIEKQRKETYKKIIESGDRAEIFRLLKTLCIRLEEQQKAGKKPHLIDERFLKEAETVLFDEFAFVLNIERESVSDYIKTELEKL